ncbi:MAG: RIP metalloprotease RseP [Negativicutes bacterium]|jgi:regulator of sigma E protease
MFSTIAVVLVFGILVFFHELGHFFTAKLTGMQVDEFAIGFGPKLISFTRGETRYSLRLIPLGGYNKIAGMDPDDNVSARGFCTKPTWAKLLVIVTGSLMNFVLPVLLLFIAFFAFGIPQFHDKPIIGSVDGQKAAYHAGINVGDRIIAINGKNVATWTEFTETLKTNGSKNVKLMVERSGKPLAIDVAPQFDSKAGKPIIGVSPKVDIEYPGLIKSAQLSVTTPIEVAGLILDGFYQMITGKMPADLAGPIGVIDMTNQVAKTGIAALLQFTAFLSINLGIINLLPLPALDGGHIIVILIEAVRRKPLSGSVLKKIQIVGFALLMTLFLYATIQDVARMNIFN